MRVDRQTALALALVTGVAAALRFATLDLQSFDHDEAVTAGRVIVPNLFDTLHVVGHGERSPPLYYLLAWVWSKPFGNGEVGLRSLSALIGTLTVPAAWFAGRALVSNRVGLLAAALVAANPYLVWYSQEARSYALMVLLTTLSLAFLAQSLRAPTTKSLALWGAMAGLALCSHYFAAFLIVPQGLWLAWKLGGRHRQALVAVGAVALVGLALLPLVIAQEGEGRRNGFAETSLAVRAGEVGLNYVAGEEPAPFAASASVDRLQALAAASGAAVFLLALFLLLLRGGDARERSGAVLAGGVASCALVVPLVLAVIGIDFVNPRNLIGGLVPLLLVVAIGLGGVRAGRLGFAGALIALVSFAAVVVAIDASTQMQRPDWRGAAEALGAPHAPRIIVTNANGDAPLEYYLGARSFSGRRFDNGVPVREVDALSTNYGVTAPRGFERVAQEGRAPSIILTRFQAPDARRITPSEVAGQSVIDERSAALIDRP